MKVILNKDVHNLGEEGDIKDVARGYARNYLIPNRLVMPYSKSNLDILESRREEIEKRRAEKLAAAQSVRERLESDPLVLTMPAGENGRLFGSVTSANIAEALDRAGITVERKRIDIPEKTIKSVGVTKVRVRLYGDEEAELKVEVKAAGGSASSSRQPAAQAAPAETATETAVEATETAVEATETAVEAEAVADEQSAADAQSAADEPQTVDEATEAAVSDEENSDDKEE